MLHCRNVRPDILGWRTGRPPLWRHVSEGGATGCALLCFLDAFSGYHQIKMAKEDEEKTAFLTPCGVFCYVCMPFGLKNISATFQRLMRIALGAQLGRNAEAYIDDIMVKTREKDTLIKDLEETFANLRKDRKSVV